MGDNSPFLEREMQEYLDPQAFYTTNSESWLNYWNDDLSLFENIENILNQCVFLKEKSILAPVVVTYMLIPSKWSKILPILACIGQAGSGKSTTSILASKIHKSTLFTPAYTFAAIRNALTQMRWLDPIGKLEREGAICCWDNIHATTLKNEEKIYQMLLFGYNRESETIEIANNDGTNITFHTFCPKILSTVDNIHLMPDFQELHRRLLVIPHKSWNDFRPQEKAQYDIDASDRLDIDSISWDGIEEKYYTFWQNVENCLKYVSVRNSFTRRNSQYKRSSEMKESQWTISVDLMTTGVVTGAWKEQHEAIEHMNKYWKYCDDVVFSDSATLFHLRNFIAQEAGSQLEMHQKLIDAGYPPIKVVISPNKLKVKIAELTQNGQLESALNPKQINEIMGSLGWKLTGSGWEMI